MHSLRRIRVAVVAVGLLAAVVVFVSSAVAKTAPVVRTVAAGDGHSLVLKTDGTLWSFGDNRFGELGTTTNNATANANPTPTPVMGGVTQIAAGGNHSLALKADGTVLSFGDNRSGQLGTTTNSGTDNANPTPSPVMSGVTQIAAGFNHSLALKADGTLWSFGDNRSGQLGTTTNNDTSNANPAPTMVMGGVTQIAAGYGHSLALKADGTLWSFGNNFLGQLGNTTNNLTFNANPVPTMVMSGVTQIAAGASHSLALTADGILWGFGDNSYGQLGTTTNNANEAANPTPTPVMSGVAQIAAGGSHSLALKTDGTLWSFGHNGYGQLGSTTNSSNHANPTPTPVLTGVSRIAAGFYHSLALKADGTVWSFGVNFFGQLGTTTNNGTSSANPTATAVLAGAAPVAPLEFTGLVPARLWDSRPGTVTVDAQGAGTGLVAAGVTTMLEVAGRGGVSTTASAVVLNVTVTQPEGPGFVTVWPCGQTRPNASNVNFDTGRSVANLVVSGIGDHGTVCFYSSAATHLIVDVNGNYPLATSYDAIVPARLFDSRPGTTTIDGNHASDGLRAGGSTTAVVVAGRGGVPTDASAVVLNVTVADSTGDGYLTVWPCGQTRPNASNVNYDTAVGAVPNLVVTAVGTAGSVCFFTSAATHLVVDVDGDYPSTTSFRGLVPARLMDTRPGTVTIDGHNAGDGTRPAGSITQLQVRGRGGVPTDADSVVVNVTVTQPQQDGYITVWPCDQTRPNTSNVNYRAGQTIANLVIAKLDTTGSICLYTLTGTHLLIDITGTIPT